MKKHRFTWLDGLIILIVVLLVAGTCVKFLVLDPNSRQKNEETISFDLKATGIRDYTVDAIRVGDKILDEEGKGIVGEISAVTVTDATSIASYPDGTLREVPVEDRYDVIITVTAKGLKEDNCYKVGAYEITVNRVSTYYTKYCVVSARVVAIHEGEK